MKVHLSKLTAYIAAITSLGASGLALTGSPANAGPAPTRSPATTVIRAPMKFRCDSLSPSAARYAKKHGYCPAWSGITPMDKRWGLCGTSQIWIANEGNGDALLHYDFESFLGNVTFRNLNIAWFNWSKF